MVCHDGRLRTVIDICDSGSPLPAFYFLFVFVIISFMSHDINFKVAGRT